MNECGFDGFPVLSFPFHIFKVLSSECNGVRFKRSFLKLKAYLSKILMLGRTVERFHSIL